MTPHRNRRRFLKDVGGSMLAASLGMSLANDLGLSVAEAADDPHAIPLGKYARLVELMRQTAAADLQPQLARMVRAGETSLTDLVAAGALANAVTFGGTDYVGFHTAMALLPALEMSRRLPAQRAPLPVLKVLYRNSQQIQNLGGAATTALHELHAHEDSAHHSGSELALGIQQACRAANTERGEQLLALAAKSEAANALQPAVQDDLDVHRFVFAHRTAGLANLLGQDFSHTLLRQCVRLCAEHERQRIARQRPEPTIRVLIPRLLDQYRLAGKQPGTRDPGDEAVEGLIRTLYEGPAEQAAEVVAGALAEGIALEVVGEAISLAANQYVLRQSAEQWRTHGDSAGVHGSDAANAWRNMTRTCDPQHAITGLLVAACHLSAQAKPFQTAPFPTAEQRELILVSEARPLLAELEDAIRHNNQGRAAAATHIYGALHGDAAPVFQLLLKYAVSEDGRLHGEKYFQTTWEEFHTTRPACRWRQVVGLARVTASGYGYNREDQQGFRAAGYEEACRVLEVEA